MIARLVFVLCSLISSVYAQEDELVLDGGLGAFHSADYGTATTKMATLGVQEDLLGPWKDRLVGGGFIDNSGNGRTGSALVSGQIGFEVNNNGTVGSIFAGPCGISHPDQTMLGGYLEFMEDLHLGIVDNHSNYIGVMYRHISDAGLTKVNNGRDFIALEIKW